MDEDETKVKFIKTVESIKESVYLYITVYLTTLVFFLYYHWNKPFKDKKAETGRPK